MAGQSSYSLLIDRLDQFIRKYYKNKIIKGSLLCASICIGLFLAYSLLEHELYLPKAGRKVLLLSYVGVLIGTFGYWVLLPLSRYFKLGNVISHEQAANILGEHFGDVEDKLLNILQLKKDYNTAAQKDLIAASIDKKSDQIKLVPFKQAIDLRRNRKYLRYALPPALLLLFLLFAAPSLITDSTYRIINNDIDFEKAAPFNFIIENENLEVVQYEDYELSVRVEGDQLPNELFLEYDNYEYRLNKTSADKFVYQFPNVRKNISFEVFSGKYRSSNNTLTVLPKPKIVEFSISADYPSYTGRKDETVVNAGDLSVPEGTKLNWKFQVQNTEEIQINFDEEPAETLNKEGSFAHTFEKRISNDHEYRIKLSNTKVPNGDSAAYFIKSIPDRYPEIGVESFNDSTASTAYFFIGNASDDYGLSKIQFVTERIDQTGNLVDSESKQIDYSISNQVQFDYVMDIKAFNLQPGERLNFYFEAFDNDQVNGSKSTKTAIMSHRQKSLEEVFTLKEENQEDIKDKLEASIDEAEDIQEALERLREELLQKDEPTWQDKKQLEKLMERQKQLQQEIEKAKQAHQENLELQKEFMNLTPEMQEKQERLSELFEELVPDEMQQLMEQIQELMEQLDKEQTLELMEEFKADQETMEKEMERLEELYKQLEVEKEMNDALEKLEELSKKQEELSEETANNDETNAEENEELTEKQEEINKEFEDLKEEFKDMLEKNDQLEFPKPIPEDAPEQMEDINQDLEESMEQMQNQEMNKASKTQNKAAQKMKQMAQSMQMQMQAGQQEQTQEDIETLRQLLENLVTLSFDQESLISNINRAVVNTPTYVSLLQEQMKIKDDFKVVEDTLSALSKRQPNLESFVLEKVEDIKLNLSSSLKELEDRKKPEANMAQRTTMKNFNDLALMLSESMEQMQQQMSNMMAGSQMCQKPGQGKNGKSGKEPKDKISKGQEKMNDALQKMMEDQKQGKGSSARDFAEAAARQAALRKALEEAAKQRQEEGQGASGELQQIIDEMDKQEIDLVNKRLDSEMMERQQNIMTRLLEAEKAQREREYDDERKSETGEELQRNIPPSLEEYLKQREAQLEEFKYVSPDLAPYYKELVEAYYKRLKRA